MIAPDVETALAGHLRACAARGPGSAASRRTLAAALRTSPALHEGATARLRALHAVVAARGREACAITARDHDLLAEVLT